MRVFIILLLQILMFQDIFTQINADFARVLDIPPFLSGSFGELRTDHFHSGIDFRTQGVIRKNVFSIDDGFVSRIRIQTGGYGKAVYIDHSGGLTSVYGHLDDFNEVIGQFVKSYQYSRQTHTLEIFPEKDKLPVKKGEFIAFSGNTGNSGGPHVHFEIRETNGQIPLNVLMLNNFGIIDKTKPVLHTLAVYPLDSMSQVNSGHSPVYFSLERSDNGTYRIQGNKKIRISGKVGFGIEAFDFLDGSSLRCGVYSIELKVQDKTIYHFSADKFSFAESRYINSHLDYPLLQSHKKRLHLLYRKVNNRLSMYKTLVQDGIIYASAGDKIDAGITVKDAAGNESALNFNAEGVEFNPQAIREIPKHIAYFRWRGVNSYTGDDAQVIVPQGALFEDFYFNYSVGETKNKLYPYLHFIHDSLTPLLKPATLRIQANMIPQNLKDKAVIVKISGNGQKVSSGGKWEGEWLVTGISTFGRYSIDVDTIFPVIRPVNISHDKDMRNLSSIRFTIDDNLTGISSYNGLINNQWVLFEYDPKNKLLFYSFDRDRLQSGMKHELEVYITDGVGNKTVYHTSFLW